jgi:hypothetical protein
MSAALGDGALNAGGEMLAKYYYSTDLTTWTSTPGVAGEVGILSGNTNMVIYNTSAFSIKYSSNLTTWTTPKGLPTYNHIFDSIVFDSKMFLCGNNNLLYVSSVGGAVRFWQEHMDEQTIQPRHGPYHFV